MRTAKIALENASEGQALLGPRDHYLKMIEQQTVIHDSLP